MAGGVPNVGDEQVKVLDSITRTGLSKMSTENSTGREVPNKYYTRIGREPSENGCANSFGKYESWTKVNMSRIWERSEFDSWCENAPKLIIEPQGWLHSCMILELSWLWEHAVHVMKTVQSNQHYILKSKEPRTKHWTIELTWAKAHKWLGYNFTISYDKLSVTTHFGICLLKSTLETPIDDSISSHEDDQVQEHRGVAQCARLCVRCSCSTKTIKPWWWWRWKVIPRRYGANKLFFWIVEIVWIVCTSKSLRSQAQCCDDNRKVPVVTVRKNSKLRSTVHNIQPMTFM